MLTTTFDYIWDKIVVPMSQCIYEKVKASNPDAEIKIKILPSNKEEIGKLYEEVKVTLKQKYHYHNGKDEERRIDIHKVSACLASVLIKYKIFDFEITEKTSDELFLCNAQLAYNVSLAIIKDNLIHQYEENNEILNKLQQNDLLMPRTTEGHDRFNLGRIKTLMLNDIFMNEFDILSYADMLYWIELFNIMLLEGKTAEEYLAKDEDYIFVEV